MFNRTWTLAALLLAATVPSQAVVKDDVAFTSFNADADGWSIVALTALAPNSTVYFTDNAWDSAAGLFVGSEGHHRWNTGPRPVTASTVVNFTRTDSAVLLAASVGSLSRARVAGSTTYDLSQTAETLYAYVGVSPTVPTEFLAALSTAGFAPPTGGLAGTGLVQGLNAAALAEAPTSPTTGAHGGIWMRRSCRL